MLDFSLLARDFVSRVASSGMCQLASLQGLSFRRFPSCILTSKLDNQQSGRADQAHCCAGMFAVAFLVRGRVARVVVVECRVPSLPSDTRHEASL